MDGRGDYFKVYCKKCGLICNPYTEMEGFMEMSNGAVFNSLPNCPRCGARQWVCYH